MPTPVAFSRAEQYLIDGIMRGERLLPVRGDGLPGLAIAGIDCALVGTPVARMGFYLFKNDDDLLDAYMARVSVENLVVDSGACCPVRERRVHPGRRGVLARSPCVLRERPGGTATTASAHRRPCLHGPPRSSKDMRSLEDWAWLGNQDVPGGPTLWQQDGVYNP